MANKKIRIKIAPGVVCPNCGADECYKDENGELRFNIRAYRVDEWSHCCVCDTWFQGTGEMVADWSCRSPDRSKE